MSRIAAAPSPAARGREANPRGPNAIRHARTQAALLQAGCELFARDGFAAARTSEIVARTGLTRGALYHHFPDKLALFAAVLEDVAARLAERIDAAAEGSPSARAELWAGCEEWLVAMAEPTLHRLYLVEGPAALGLPRWREIDAKHGGRSLREGIAATLAERGDDRPDVEAFTALLSGALNEAALWVAEAEDSEVAGRAMRSSLELLLTRLFEPSRGA